MDQGDDSEPWSLLPVIEPGTLPWVIDNIESLLNRRLTPDAESRRTIDRVPSNLRGAHNKSFGPEMIGIGPFNKPREREGSSSRLQVMEEHKLRFLNRLLEGKLELHRRDENMRRTTEGERVSDDRQREEDDEDGQTAKAVLLDGLAKAMWSSKPEIEACYSGNHDYNFRINFVENMVVDGCFVVELLRIHYDIRRRRIDWSAIKDDPIIANPRILTTLRRDLLLLENQLPFFVLEKLYQVIHKNNTIDDQQAVSLEELALTFFGQLFPGRHAAFELDAGKPKAQHLLDVVHSTFLQSVSGKLRQKMKKPVEFDDCGMGLHFASELEEAGVQFEKKKRNDFLDIEFISNGTLRVPPLSLNDNNLSLLLNIVAYELSVNHPEPFFTNYLTFWDSLVNSPRDIQVLHKHGIINSMGNEEDVVKLFVRCRDAIYDMGYLCHEITGVNWYYERYDKSKYRFWWRSLIRERFSSPWTCLSLFAAIILLLLTLLQTIYTVYPYYQPN